MTDSTMPRLGVEAMHLFGLLLGADQVRKPPSWPRSYADFSLLYCFVAELYSHRNALANLDIFGPTQHPLLQADTIKANLSDEPVDAVLSDLIFKVRRRPNPYLSLCELRNERYGL
jgi:hypothetical protein